MFIKYNRRIKKTRIIRKEEEDKFVGRKLINCKRREGKENETSTVKRNIGNDQR